MAYKTLIHTHTHTHTLTTLLTLHQRQTATNEKQSLSQHEITIDLVYIHVPGITVIDLSFHVIINEHICLTITYSASEMTSSPITGHFSHFNQYLSYYSLYCTVLYFFIFILHFNKAHWHHDGDSKSFPQCCKNKHTTKYKSHQTKSQ